MKISKVLTLCILLSGVARLEAATFYGNHEIVSSGTEAGDLTIDGVYWSVEGGVDIGVASVSGTTYPGVSLSYVHGGTSAFTLGAANSAVIFEWQSAWGLTEEKTKMALGADNVLSLYSTSGTATITLNPNTGEITTNGEVVGGDDLWATSGSNSIHLEGNVGVGTPTPAARGECWCWHADSRCSVRHRYRP